MSDRASRPITGTHLYSLPRCARAVALEFWGEPAARRPLREEEEFLLARGRAHEAAWVGPLAWPEPEYPRGDFAAGAAATQRLLEAGVPGIVQGVLTAGEAPAFDLLGIPDLLRRAPGASALGEHHYVVGDVKSSSRPRGDQILQLSLYAHLLERVQGRFPARGFLVMKDGHEEAIDLAAYRPAFDDALARVRTLRASSQAARPFFSAACENCRWSPVCLPELEANDDLSLVDGMTEGLRTMLEIAGVGTAQKLARAQLARLVRDTHVETALMRRLVAAAKARGAGAPQRQPRTAGPDELEGILLHVLTDGFADRLVAVGARWLEAKAPRFLAVCPGSRDEEAPAFAALIAQLPRDRKLLHHGRALRNWLTRQSELRGGVLAVENRLVDLERRLRACAAWPAPVTGLPALVRSGLGRDPHRAGRNEAVAAWLAGPDAEQRLVAKLRTDLEDLHDLVLRWLCAPGDPTPASLGGEEVSHAADGSA